MKITLEYLKSINACQESIEKYLKAGEPKTIKKCFDLLLKQNKLDWANWFICRILNKKQKTQYAIFAAKQVLPIFEKKYPEDNRPRKAIKAAEKYLKNPTKKNKNDAAAAAYDAAAAAAAYDADYAADYDAAAAAAAYDAAAAAAAAAAADYAADYAAAYDAAAAAAAYDAAADAADADAADAYAAARNKMKIKIIKFGLKLSNKKRSIK